MKLFPWRHPMKFLKIPSTLKAISTRLREVEQSIADLHKRSFLTPAQERFARELKLLRLLLKDRTLDLAPSTSFI